ncbi:DNA-3-methyladenine glycosylase I [Photobacterium sp. WH77]|uniref:DNA-3-methyladenine glycosylase I n=1 Tax=Photobacterium arenosum TaxID=2774143 RepID=A0ABR9BG18_9GAMM|nr:MULTISPECIES: DNA-3-methyladenine glycosylase I [Photobacterium]MBD8511515.1 DNA-3-methyladenine glycosylase I [Photobacterium arenosum]MBV7263855.1 DNA-3-methyladenine glycosylase I [Photobacterium sp. WH24]MCG2837551.1 DNA-3-methyladenine glycosylase I [Photobacterium sp. WH77]MCG2845167.1 DNA-3-methyladenine glycosylase I [Photobacterium sp. WH80]MDO6583319.1 DNA-3-methyladenine glycosylase I [Photobacterium sp. 2_MG-2023]
MIEESKVCAWAMHQPLEREYHDTEWGLVVTDDKILFEFITLEGAQAGLSWYTILKRREAYRQAFADFDIKQLAEWGDEEAEAILTGFDIIKHRGKVNSVFTNANAALALQKEFGSLSAALWQFVDGVPINNRWESIDQVPASSEQSKAMSKFLKKRGFKFVGETICYAFMQAVGMVNDHLVDCYCYERAVMSQGAAANSNTQ